MKYGAQTLGVHGQELPKFQDNPHDSYYWKMKQDYNPTPRIQSLSTLKQEHKFWAKKDEMLLSANSLEPGPIDHFKASYVKIDDRNRRVACKVNEVRHSKYPDYIGEKDFTKGWKPSMKWSHKEKKIRCEGKEAHLRTLEKVY